MTGRFAPTPSGRMHVGNVYAMLAAWLDARSRGERMLLRIEDIDIPRVLPDADRWIMDDLHWLGLDWDGEPVYQSQRGDLYAEALKTLAEMRDAQSDDVAETKKHNPESTVYPCFCSRADIRAASAPQEGDGFQIYPGTCRRLLAEHPDEVARRLAANRQHSLRLAMPSDSSAVPAHSHPQSASSALVTPCHPERSAEREAEGSSFLRFTDQIFGTCSYDLTRDIGDTVIRRADGVMSYQLVVTVDDLAQGVTSVVRGRDLLRSTALQLHIRQLLLRGGFSPATESKTVAAPVQPERATLSFVHLPLIDNAAGRRLAKRERSLDMGALRARGVTAEQIIGYCAWLLRLIPEPTPCRAADLVDSFSWEPLHANHPDRRLDPTDPSTPQWLAAAL